MVFETHTISEGWDGQEGAKQAPSGVYVYSLAFKDAKGKHFFKTGTVLKL